MNQATDNSATKTAGGGVTSLPDRIAQLEAENRKLRDIIAQMVAVATAADLLADHHPIQPQQRRPVDLVEARVLSDVGGGVHRLGPDVSHQVG